MRQLSRRLVTLRVRALTTRRCGTQPDARERSRSAESASGDDSTTIRAVWPVSRASTRSPSSISVRMTTGFAGSETSTWVRCAPRNPPPSTSRRSPERSSASGACDDRSSDESSRGVAARASTALRRPPSSAQMTRPSVLTMSGSSTPASCTLVCDVSSGAAPAPGAASADGRSVRWGIGGIGRATTRGTCARA